MKRIIILLLILKTVWGFGQYQVSISGTITMEPIGNPVPNQVVFLEITMGNDSLNTLYEEVYTNMNGLYTYSFLMNTTFARIDFITPDCNGNVQTATAYATPDSTSIIQNFFLCSQTSCHAFFLYEQNGQNSVQFLNQSTGETLFYLWDFGDNVTSSLQSPSHTYNEPGNYLVCLFIMTTDSSCYDLYCDSVNVSGGGGCLAQFTYYPDPISSGYGIQFIDMSNANVNAWSWNFGDGGFAQVQNPLYNYNEPGTYQVCLTIFGPNCQSTWCQYVTVTGNPGCYNYFTYQSDGNTVYLNGIHSPAIPATYLWDFGDGTSGDGQNTSHTYSQNGVYYITLNTTDSLDCSATSSQPVVVGDTIIFTQVFGQVFQGNFPMQNGQVRITSIQNNPGFGPFSEVTSVDPTGVFLFPYVPNGEFLLYAIPGQGSGYLPTYFGGALHWQDAFSFNSNQAGMMFAISLDPIDAQLQAGNAGIFGQVSRALLRDDQLGQIQVLLYNDNFEALSFTTVGTDGMFEFTDIDTGLYYIYPELAGVNSTIIPVKLTETLQQNFIYLSFDGTSILGLEEHNPLKHGLKVYPNPASEKIYLSFDRAIQGQIIVTLADLTGRVRFSHIYDTDNGNLTFEVPVENLVSGVYFLHIRDKSGQEAAVKIVKR